MSRGGLRKGAGRPAGSIANKKRVKSTVTLFQKDWDELDRLGASRGKAIERLLEFYRGGNTPI